MISILASNFHLVIPIPEGESTALGALLMHEVQKETLIDVIALRACPKGRTAWRCERTLPAGVKQSPRQVGDRFVAENAPRDDTSKFLSSVFIS